MAGFPSPWNIASLSNVRFVWFRNYLDLLNNPVFWTAVRNTFYFALVGGPLTVALSLGAAVLLNARLTRFRTLFRTIFFGSLLLHTVLVIEGGLRWSGHQFTAGFERLGGSRAGQNLQKGRADLLVPKPLIG